MTDFSELRGLGHIMITPFNPDQTIDESSLRSVVNFACASGASALIPLGIMGEAHRLTEAERERVISVVVACTANRVAVIVGCSAESTVATIDRVKTATNLGADAVMVASPRAATTPKLQIGHFKSVCDAIEVPLVLQDEPVTTGVTMSSQTIATISEHERLGAIKVEESPSPSKISGILEFAPSARCFGGLGGLYLIEELNRGAVGVMTGFALPQVLADICQLYDDGDVAAARQEFYKYLPLIRYEAQLGVGGVAIRKQFFVERGVVASATVREPSPAPDPRTLGELQSLLKEIVG